MAGENASITIGSGAGSLEKDRGPNNCSTSCVLSLLGFIFPLKCLAMEEIRPDAQSALSGVNMSKRAPDDPPCTRAVFEHYITMPKRPHGVRAALKTTVDTKKLSWDLVVPNLVAIPYGLLK